MINTEFRPDCSGIYKVSQAWRPHGVSWASCSNAWLSLWWKLFLYLARASLISIHTLCSLFSHHVPLRRAWLHLLDSLHVCIGRLLLSPPKTFLQAKQAQLSQALLVGQGLWALTRPSWLPSSRTAPVDQHASCTGGPKNGCSISDGIYQVLSKGH